MNVRLRNRLLLTIVVGIALVAIDLAVGIVYSVVTEDMTEKYFSYDEEIGLLHKLNVSIEMPWPEYGREMVHFRTNNLGFRENTATDSVTHHRTRVLVFGDSHTDGVIDNDESFSNLIEAGLNRGDTLGVEIINAGVGLFTLKSQWQLCRRFLWLKPDVVVFAIFTGNDYAEILHPPLRPSIFDHWLKNGIVPRIFRKLNFTSRARAERINQYAMWQSLGQADFFKRHPEKFAEASRLHEELVARIQANTQKQNIKVLFLILPSKYSVERESLQDFELMEKILNLQAEDRLEYRIADDLRGIFHRRQVNFVDVQSEIILSEQGKSLFWNADHHLGREGHMVVAGIVEPVLASIIESRLTAP
ncbi:MAG: SGNH/GDSL hydrolase family protein [Bacteroidota bacterium]